MGAPRRPSVAIRVYRSPGPRRVGPGGCVRDGPFPDWQIQRSSVWARLTCVRTCADKKTRTLDFVTPLQLSLDITPRARLELTDVRCRAAAVHGDALDSYARCLYCSLHTTAGYLPQSLHTRLAAGQHGIASYINVYRAVFPQGGGYRHDDLDRRVELTPEQRPLEPQNADSHLAFMFGGLHSCVSYATARPGPVYFIDLDGVSDGTPRHRVTVLVGYDNEVEVARTTLRVPVSSHPIDAVSLKNPKFGLYEQLRDFIAQHGVEKGRLRLALAPGERHASLTVNEYETLLMRHDLTEVFHEPLRFAAEKARHAWNDPRAVPLKALDYAKYDLVRALNQLVDAVGLSASRIERLLARAVALPASRFFGMKRSVGLLVSDANPAGRASIVEGTYQSPILIQWRATKRRARTLDVSLTCLR